MDDMYDEKELDSFRNLLKNKQTACRSPPPVINRLSVVLNLDDFPFSKGIWQYLETFLLASTWREGSCYWHLVGRNQECCFTSYNTENSSPQQKLTSPEIPTVLRLNSSKMVIGTHFYQRLPIDALEILFQKKINKTFKHTFSDVINRGYIPWSYFAMSQGLSF